MKKIILTATMAICTVGLFAQTAAPSSSGISSKKGEMYLPEAGDWAISFDAAPFLNYFGAFLSNAGASSPTANFLSSNNAIIGKYFVDEKTAYRGILRIGFNSNSITQQTTQDLAPTLTVVPPPPLTTVSDKLSLSSHFIGLGAGMEMRKGHTRLQGYYGAELMFWLSSGGNDSTMTYGNAYSQTNDPTPSFYNFGTGQGGQTISNGFGSYSGGRITADKPGSIFGISALAFIGFEYYFMPKISVGAEYTWGISFWSQGQGTLTRELIYQRVPTDPNPVDATVTTKTAKGSHFGIDTGVNSVFGNNSNPLSGAGSASLNITFHF